MLLPTKLFLTTMAVQVNPQFTANVVLNARIFLIVKSVQSPTDNSVYLHEKHESS